MSIFESIKEVVCDTPIKFLNRDLYNLVTEDQLGKTGVIAFVVENEIDIPVVEKWIARTIMVTGNAFDHSAESIATRLTRDAVKSISYMANNFQSNYMFDTVILWGDLTERCRILHAHGLSQSIKKPVFLVTTKESMGQKFMYYSHAPYNQIPGPEVKSTKEYPEQFMATCVTEAIVENGEIKELRNVRNQQTQSGYCLPWVTA